MGVRNYIYFSLYRYTILSKMGKKLRIHELAELVGRSTGTIRRWEAEGKLSVKRLPSGQRYFDESDVRLVQGRAPAKKLCIVYCRVSGPAQKDDLASQVKAMEQFCLGAGWAVDDPRSHLHRP